MHLYFIAVRRWKQDASEVHVAFVYVVAQKRDNS